MVLVLLGSQPRLVLPVLQAAHDLGVRASILLGTAATRGLRWSMHCHDFLPTDLDRPQLVAQQLRALAREHPDAVVVPCDCPAIRVLQALGGRLPLRTVPLPTAATLEALDDKWAFHRLCTAHGLPVPATVHVEGKHALHYGELVAAVGLPFVVKPANASGSLGVVVVHDRDALESGIVRDPSYVQGPLVVQAYVDGSDIDVDLFAVEGQVRAITTHVLRGHWMEFLRHPALEDLARRLCEVTGYSGPMNLDARVDRRSGEVVLIESNPRFWASLASPLACGLNFLAEALPGALPPAVEARRPTLARCNRRHPLLRPAEWWRAIADDSAQGRQLRATLRDPYSLLEFLGELPAMTSRQWRRAGGGSPAKAARGGAKPSVQP